MGKYFGTDGIRGKANEGLTCDMAFKVGQYLGYYYGKNQHKTKIVVGKDTRLSSDMFEHAIAAGASATGADVYLVDVCPTPCVAYLVSSLDFDCGVMISASHNPFHDNGIKVFNHQGQKIANEIELEIENYLDHKTTIEFAHNEEIGKVIYYQEGLELYLSHLQKIVDLDLSDMRIAMDCANGSSTTTAEKMMKRLNAQYSVIHHEPDGININTQCGSTHPESLIELMKKEHYDLGLAFDGDADRLIAVNSKGELIDGDYVLYICGQYLKSKGLLNYNTVVTTVMANLGLFKAFETLEIDYDKTAVGDKYVFESMVKNDYVLGGEQSGHIIFKQYATTGDGLLTALMLLKVMKETGKSIEALSEGLVIYPQLLINERVKDKNDVLNDPTINQMIEEITQELGNDGRILVRPSGTEPLIRVMVEAKTQALCEKYVYRVIDYIKENHI